MLDDRKRYKHGENMGDSRELKDDQAEDVTEQLADDKHAERTGEDMGIPIDDGGLTGRPIPLVLGEQAADGGKNGTVVLSKEHVVLSTTDDEDDLTAGSGSGLYEDIVIEDGNEHLNKTAEEGRYFAISPGASFTNKKSSLKFEGINLADQTYTVK